MPALRSTGLALILGLAAPILLSASEPADTAQERPARVRPQIEFGPRGELIVDGERRFIRGGYRSGQVDTLADALPSAADAGFDLVHDYHFESLDLERHGVKRYIQDARAYLRRADKLGLGVFLGLPRKAVMSADEETLTAIVNALSDERALWMWYIYDEPRPEELSFENAERVYRLLKKLDPQRPAIMLTNRTERVSQYQAYCDLLWYDRYPIAATSVAKSSLKPIKDVLDSTLKTVGGRKPVWAVVQAQDNKGSPKLRKRAKKLDRPNDRNHRPNEADLRAQAHVAIASGVMAVVYYWGPDSWYSMKTDTPGIWASLGRVLKELGALEPVLLAGPAPHALQMTAGDARVVSWTRAHGGKVYVGLANTDINAPATVAFQSPDARGPFSIKGGGDGKLEQTGNGTARVRLGPSGVIVLAAEGQAPEQAPATGRR